MDRIPVQYMYYHFKCTSPEQRALWRKTSSYLFDHISVPHRTAIITKLSQALEGSEGQQRQGSSGIEDDMDAQEDVNEQEKQVQGKGKEKEKETENMMKEKEGDDEDEDVEMDDEAANVEKELNDETVPDSQEEVRTIRI